ncbi:dihydroneopterin aldolase [Legionella birminghamensis]|uniref:7,8-dihydroneopterin aldolase n=1 Tax=Legionella birminghamensis TaxID=28083 RepID=A0A378IC14_9GAMM|nr:dihydroneopterin aldolase [Legionella birminghamensis]KTC71706.1 dihydroneopterin aldolase [Legionella birminghamensis]STX32456.1 dihydroneopterin aldolase [Legionella birminghamensis]
MDTLEIKALKIATRIGVHQWEQQIKQNLFIDITIPSDFSQCEDALDKTTDYDALCRSVTDYVESNSFQLIETVAEHVAALVKREFKLEQVCVSVSKPHSIPNAGDVRVTVSR